MYNDFAKGHRFRITGTDIVNNNNLMVETLQELVNISGLELAA
jgi:hypothetical protein